MTPKKTIADDLVKIAKQIRLHQDIDATNWMLAGANEALAILGKSERYKMVPYPHALHD